MISRSGSVSTSTSNRRLMLFGLVVALGIGTANATESVTLQVEVEALDLDSGLVLEQLGLPAEGESGADIKLAYNADRSPHAVVLPAEPTVSMAMIVGVGFDGISAEDVADLQFSTDAIDFPFSSSVCVVVRTDQGAVFKLGNATESGAAVTFNYAAL